MRTDGSPHSSALARSGPIKTSQQGVTLCLEASLRALMPTCDTAALIVGLRMTERLQKYEQYVEYWSSRPQAPVAGSAALWWQHAGRATLSQCQQLTRSQVQRARFWPCMHGQCWACARQLKADHCRPCLRHPLSFMYASASAARSAAQPGRPWITTLALA